MEEYIYPATLAIVAILAFTFYRNHNTILMVLALLGGAYAVYSHETGYTATDFKNEMVEDLDESAQEYREKHANDSYDLDKSRALVK